MTDELDDIMYDELDDSDASELDALEFTYFGIIVDEDLKRENQIYAGTEIYLMDTKDKVIINGIMLDVTGDELGEAPTKEFNSLQDALLYIKDHNVQDCPYDLNNFKF